MKASKLFVSTTAAALFAFGSIGLAGAQTTPPPNQTNPPTDSAGPQPGGSSITPQAGPGSSGMQAPRRSDAPGTMSDPATSRSRSSDPSATGSTTGSSTGSMSGGTTGSDTRTFGERAPRADRN